MKKYLLAASLLCGSMPALAVSISGIEYSGSGCPEHSAAVNISDDGQALTVAFDQFYAEITDRVFDLAKCNIKLKLDVPAGQSVGLFCVDYRGFGSVDYGVGAEFGSSYRFSDQEPYRSLGKTKLPEEHNDDFALLSVVPQDQILWSGCGGQLELDLKAVAMLYVNHFGRGVPRGWQPLTPDTGGYLAVDSVDGEFKMHYGLATRRCR